MAFAEISKKFPDFGLLLSVQGSAFEALMGPEWAGAHPETPFFQTRDQVGRLLDQKHLEFGDMRAAMERFLSDERVFEDLSGEVESVRSAYRDLYLRLVPDFWDKLEGEMLASVNEPEAQCRAALLALSLWPSDPRLDPGSWKLWFAAGFAFVQRGDLDRAAASLDRAIAAEPRAVPALNELAALRLQQNRLVEGEALLSRVLEAEPDNLLALCNLAGLRIEAGRMPEALPLLERAKAVDPEDPFLKQLLEIVSR